MRNLEPFLTTDIKNAIHAHMISSDEEVCGIIFADGDTYRYEAIDNVSNAPKEAFSFSKVDSTRLATDKNAIAYVHTHPDGPMVPSKKDMQIQQAIGKPSVIAAREKWDSKDILSATIYSMRRYTTWSFTTAYMIVGKRYDAGTGKNWTIKLEPMPRNDWWWDARRQDEVEEDDRYV